MLQKIPGAYKSVYYPSKSWDPNLREIMFWGLRLILHNVHDCLSPRIFSINPISVLIIHDHPLCLLYYRTLTSYKFIQRKVEAGFCVSTSKMEFYLKAQRYDTLISESARVAPGLLNCKNLILQLSKPVL